MHLTAYLADLFENRLGMLSEKVMTTYVYQRSKMRHQNIGLRMVMENRARDDSFGFYREAEHQDKISRQKAEFESRTATRFTSSEIKRRAKTKSQEAEDDLNRRRESLRELLRAEEEQFSWEVTQSIETPTQRRARLQQKLAGILQEKEREHQEEVQQKLYNRWVEECDPLRAQISKAFEREIVRERDQQVMDRQMARMEEDVEEAKYVQEVQKGVREFRERQLQEEEDRRRKQRQNRDAWTADIHKHNQSLIRQRERTREEGLEFRRRNEMDIQRAREDAEDRRRAQEARRRELDELNQEQIAYRKHFIDEEKRLDQKYLKQAQDELRKEQEDAMIARLVAKKKANANRELLEMQMSRVKASDMEAEMYLEQVQDEVNRKKDEEMRRDAERRRRLMLDARRGQEEQMQARDEDLRQRVREKLEERRKIEEDLEEKRILDAEQQEQKRLKGINQARMLENQIEMRRRIQAQRRYEERESAKSILAGWQEEEEKIKQALQHPENFVGRRFRGHR